MALLSNFLIGLLVNLAKAWLANKAIKDSAVDEYKLSQIKAEQDVESKVDAAISAVKPLTASDVQHIKPGTDPDFRD